MATSVGFETATVSGWWKTVYESLEKAVPSFAVCKGMIPFKSDGRTGLDIRFPVHLRRSQGYTWKGASGSIGTVYTLNSPESPVIDQATAVSVECTLQEDIAFGALAKANGGKASYDDLLDLIVGENMKEGIDFQQELLCIYGGGAMTRWANGIGVVESEADAGAGTNDITFTPGTWNAGIWVQLEGSYIDVYASDLSTLRNAATIQVTSVSLSTRTITVTGTEAELDTIAASDVVFPRGTNGQWVPGIMDQLSNAGTILGISASTYTLWAPNSYAMGSDKLSYAKIMKGLTTGVYKGLDQDVTILVNPDGWTDMANDAAALRRWTEDQKAKVEMGTGKLVFHGVTMGTVSIVPHPLMMQGFAAGIVGSTWHRYGATDTTFKLPNAGDRSEDAFFVSLENSTGVRFRCYFDIAPVCKRPAINTIFTGIVNNT